MARMFHATDYIMEKTFVYGIICLFKWLSKDRFQEGLYGYWPPKMPEHLQPKGPEAGVIQEE